MDQLIDTYDFHSLLQSAFQVGYNSAEEFWEATPRIFFHRLIAYWDEELKEDTRFAQLQQMMHATSMAEEKPPSMDKLLGFDGTEYADSYISADEYDFEEHEDA